MESMLHVIYSILRVEPLDKLLKEIAEIISKEFNIRYVIVGLWNEETEIFEEKVLYGYSEETKKKLGKRSYTWERTKADLKEEYECGVPLCYYVRPVDIGVIRKEEFAYISNPSIALSPRKSPEDWQPLDYIDFVMTDKDGNWIGWFEILEPNDFMVPGMEVLKRIRIFADLASIAIENAKTFEKVNSAKQESEGYLDLILHDIVNRLTPLLIYQNRLAEQGELKGSNVKILENVIRISSSIERLVLGVRAMSKVKGDKVPKLAPLELKTLIDECLIELIQNYPDNQVSIKKKYPKNDAVVPGDNLMEFLFYNILENALRFSMKKEVQIAVEILERDGSWHVEVEDHGKGIPDSMKEVIFSRFTGQARDTKGTGLGMSLVGMLVKRYGGTINVSDRIVGDYSKGARISVSLPKVK